MIDPLARARTVARWFGFLIMLGMLFYAGCADQPAKPRQARVTEVVSYGQWNIAHVVECDGRRYLLNTAGGIIELPAKPEATK